MVTENEILAQFSSEEKASDSSAGSSATKFDEKVSRSWSQLPPELIQVIFEHCTMLDYIRASSVCRSWASIAAEKRHPPAHQLPWLMIYQPWQPDDDEDIGAKSGLCDFFSPFDGQFHRLPVPELHKRRCCGSSEGWLITVDENVNLALFNPFSRAEIPLPSQLQCPITLGFRKQLKQMKDMFCTPHFIRKAILSSDPRSKRECVVVAITAYDRLIYCRPGDGQWSTFDGQYDAYEDLTFFMGRLCAVKNIEEVASCSFRPEPRWESMNVPPLHQIGDGTCQRYLVESCGGLLLVLRYFGDGQLYNTIGFEVYELEMEGPMWVEVKNLGDQMLFLGASHSEAYSAERFSGSGFKGNCIYFTGESVRVGRDKFLESTAPYVCQDIGVFSLDEWSISEFCSFSSDEKVKSPIWVKPNPW